MNESKTDPKSAGTSGKIVVAALLALGLAGALVLSRNMPRRNPKVTDPGNPYYSPPTDEELKASSQKELERQK